MTPVAATAATEFTAPRQHGGNSEDGLSGRADTVNAASCLTPVAENVAENENGGHFPHQFGLLEPYRYGDSNPGFRTENWKMPY
jgi:hypothetical protein